MTEFLLSPEGVSALLGLCLGLLGRACVRVIPGMSPLSASGLLPTRHSVETPGLGKAL